MEKLKVRTMTDNEMLLCKFLEIRKIPRRIRLSKTVELVRFTMRFPINCSGWLVRVGRRQGQISPENHEDGKISNYIQASPLSAPCPANIRQGHQRRQPTSGPLRCCLQGHASSVQSANISPALPGKYIFLLRKNAVHAEKTYLSLM